MFKNAYVQKLRKQLKLTQNQLAEICGVHPVTVSNWERGARQPDIKSLEVLAHTLHVTVDALITESEKNTRAKNVSTSDNYGIQLNNSKNNGTITQTVNGGVSQNNGESSGGTVTTEAVSLPSMLYSDLESALRLRREWPSVWRVMCAGGLSDEQVRAVARALDEDRLKNIETGGCL